ncbi:MAG: hypothetical protein ACK5LF_25340, partial [Bacteroides xylanisolvens]
KINNGIKDSKIFYMEVFNREKVNIGNEKIPPIIQICTDFYIDNLRITIKSVLICVIGGET